jgi:hypothetical protein
MISKIRIFLNRIAPRYFSCGLKFEDRVIDDLFDIQKEAKNKKLKGMKPFNINGKVFWAISKENAQFKYDKIYGDKAEANTISINNAN